MIIVTRLSRPAVRSWRAAQLRSRSSRFQHGNATLVRALPDHQVEVEGGRSVVVPGGLAATVPPVLISLTLRRLVADAEEAQVADRSAERVGALRGLEARPS
ncbi:hypothetical protein [Streptomyces sp. NPDC056921]|uniref:hypothetical protein n=1 Tax=Streptomyces sp. NPDC056921 TaxID=3345966 RepID=UPI0036382A5B